MIARIIRWSLQQRLLVLLSTLLQLLGQQEEEVLHRIMFLL